MLLAITHGVQQLSSTCLPHYFYYSMNRLFLDILLPKLIASYLVDSQNPILGNLLKPVALKISFTALRFSALTRRSALVSTKIGPAYSVLMLTVL